MLRSLSAKSLWCLASLGTTALVASCAGSSPEDAQAPSRPELSPQAREALLRGFEELKAGIPASLLSDYGFADQAQLDRVEFGDPIPVYWMQDTSLMPKVQWQVPLQDSGQALAWLLLDSSGGKWESGAMGSALLARRWQALCTQEGNCSEARLLRIPAIQSDYMQNGSKLIPLNPSQETTDWMGLVQRLRQTSNEGSKGN
jgi:hypothetical protein